MDHQHVGAHDAQVLQDLGVRQTMQLLRGVAVEGSLGDVNGKAGLVLVGHTPEHLQQVLGVGPDGSGSHPDLDAAVLAVVIGLKEAAQVLLDGVHILHDAGMNAELLAGVHAATAQNAADAQLLHGVDDAVGEFSGGMGIHIIQHGGDTAVQTLHAAQHGGQVAVIAGQVGGSGEGHGLQPVLEHHVIAQALEQGLEEVVVGVDKAGEDDLAVQVGDLGGVGVLGFQSVAGADLHDAVALDGHSTVEKDLTVGIDGDNDSVFQQMVDHSSCAPFQISRRKLPRPDPPASWAGRYSARWQSGPPE